jgi:hypothetical protein
MPPDLRSRNICDKTQTFAREDPKKSKLNGLTIVTPIGLFYIHRLIIIKYFYLPYLLQWEQAYLVVLIKNGNKQKNWKKLNKTSHNKKKTTIQTLFKTIANDTLENKGKAQKTKTKIDFTKL